jgi:CheY-like chemotaxis protein
MYERERVRDGCNLSSSAEQLRSDRYIRLMACIVVADDDPDIRRVTEITLRRAGHTVMACEDGGALLKAVRAATPDVVVTDNQMPVLTGIQVLTLLREDPATADIPVILATGSVPPAEAELLLDDSDQLLPKPFTGAQLREAVDSALRYAAT